MCFPQKRLLCPPLTSLPTRIFLFQEKRVCSVAERKEALSERMERLKSIKTLTGAETKQAFSTDRR